MSSIPTEADRPPLRSNRSRTRWLLAGLIVLAIGGFHALGLGHYLSWDYLRGNVDALKSWVDDNLLLAAVGYIALYTAITALSLPVANVTSIVGGAIFGRWLGTCLVLPAATCGATLAMLSSRYLFRDLIRRTFAARLEALDRGVRRDGAYYLFTLRLVPIVPFFLINLGIGLTTMPARTFFWVSLVGMLPGTFVYVNAGTALGTIESPRDILSPTVLLSFALLGVAPLLFRWLARALWSAAV